MVNWTFARAEEMVPATTWKISLMIPMRDGITLESWITKPSHLKKPVPTVFTLTQYDIDGGRHGDSAAYYARRGDHLCRSMRGRGRSGGLKSDSLACRWVGTATMWSNGSRNSRGAMAAASSCLAAPLWGACTSQWRTAAQLPPHLAAISLCAYLSGLGCTEHQWHSTGLARLSSWATPVAALSIAVSSPISPTGLGRRSEQMPPATGPSESWMRP